MYTVCPICNTDIEPGDEICKGCGFRLSGNTQEFKPIDISNSNISQSKIQTTEEKVAQLKILRGLQKDQAYILKQDNITLGRDPNCTIFLNDMTVSRNHALIDIQQGYHVIHDQGSFNGVWVNNRNVSSCVLHNGDIIQLGSFCLEYNC